MGGGRGEGNEELFGPSGSARHCERPQGHPIEWRFEYMITALALLGVRQLVEHSSLIKSYFH